MMSEQEEEIKIHELLYEIDSKIKKIDFLTSTESFLNLETSEKNLNNATNLLSDSSKLVLIINLVSKCPCYEISVEYRKSKKDLWKSTLISQ